MILKLPYDTVVEGVKTIFKVDKNFSMEKAIVVFEWPVSCGFNEGSV